MYSVSELDSSSLPEDLNIAAILNVFVKSRISSAVVCRYLKNDCGSGSLRCGRGLVSSSELVSSWL